MRLLYLYHVATIPARQVAANHCRDVLCTEAEGSTSAVQSVKVL